MDTRIRTTEWKMTKKNRQRAFFFLLLRFISSKISTSCAFFLMHPKTKWIVFNGAQGFFSTLSSLGYIESKIFLPIYYFSHFMRCSFRFIKTIFIIVIFSVAIIVGVHTRASRILCVFFFRSHISWLPFAYLASNFGIYLFLFLARCCCSLPPSRSLSLHADCRVQWKPASVRRATDV